MAKLTRTTQLVFGSSPGIDQIGVFGSFAAGTPTFTNSPATIQSLANYLEGWFSAVDGENSPCIEDMNALCFLYAYQLAYIMQAGIPEWDAGTTYYLGSLVNDPAGTGIIYRSLTNTNLNNALTSPTNWAVQSGASGFTTVTTSTTIAAGTAYLRSNSTAGNLTQTLPAIASTPVGTTIRIKDVGTGGFSTTLVANGTDTIDGSVTYSSVLNGYDSVTVYCTGTTWDVIFCEGNFL
jgi:hypothetical protein